MESLEGQLLLASPQLLDPNFVRTVVLLVEHNDMGAFGLVINRPTGKTVQELWKQVGESPCENQQPVHLGGPVSGPLMAIHTADGLAEMEILAGVFFAAKKQNLDELVRRDERCKIFIGHSGWGPGQLEGEIEQGAWRTIPAKLEDVFDAADDLWQRLMQRAVAGVLPEMLGIKQIPPDPSLN
ncbi:MAG: YqgE/AlgH family protein [Thermoguttaceae bacterium]|jgi:putative transcriptional regulator